ncbi:MAG: DUF6797 domain-containing protein [Gemmataceae bacterium]|nr:hypothetical protein [Gemmata sp.]MDW8196591.1 DUF6797 domain-containing protein [Gemmataceae bacterium]
MTILWLLTAVTAAPPPVPIAPAPREVDLILRDWTPRPATGKAEPWEKATEKDWIDPRFREMNTGPALNGTLRYPLGPHSATIYKATAVKLGDATTAGAVFDRNTLQLSAAWTGGYLHHSDRRFGLLNTPTPKGDLQFAAPPGPGWANPQGHWDAPATPFTAPLPADWAKYHGLYHHGSRVVFRYRVDTRTVLESPQTIAVGDQTVVVSTLEIGPGKTAVQRFLCELEKIQDNAGLIATTIEDDELAILVSGAAATRRVAWVRHCGGISLPTEGRATIVVPASPQPIYLTVGVARIAAKDLDAFIEKLKKLPAPQKLTPFTQPGPKRWGKPIITPLERGHDHGPFALDTLTIPYQNPFKALFFCTGVDFLKDGRIAVCTCHGDVWLVQVDEKAGTCAWQRFATGLYQPLGLKVVDDRVVVLERGQLTRLHDGNDDGEADFYECLNNDWHTGGGEHSYDTCLETDPEGHFYFFKTGDTDTPTGGCLLRVSKDGTRSEVFCTGFRHPIGLGISPTGIITGADQEGNWMPATRIDEYRRGGFYGDMRAHHRPTPPTTYDPPICWLPREVDNSAGGQVWVPEKTFGPLAGLPLHFSYGRCRPFVLLRQPLHDGTVQGGVVPLPIRFLAGVCRGRFHSDGHLYVCGLNGWQTAAQADGCLQRVRYTGQPLDLPLALEVRENTLRLTFSRPLEARAVENTANFAAAWWNYRWSGEYGSKRWKVSDPQTEGQDDVPIRSARLLADGRTVELTFTKLVPVMQMMVGYNLTNTDGRPVVGAVYLTIHSTQPPRK